MPVTVTTDLPDAANITLDNSVEDEVTGSVDDTINYGEYNWQVRESNENQSWGAVADVTTGEADPDYVFQGLEDGEKYDVRVRTETEHKTGSWVSASTVTLLPAPSSLSVTGSTTTSLTIGWNDNADNEDGYRVYREKKYDSGYASPTEIADLSANSTSYTDNNVQPGETYRYSVEVYTEHVIAQSGKSTGTPNSINIPQSRKPQDGWRVEVERSDGRTVCPTIVAEPTINPRINEFPIVKVPVEPSTEWLDLEGQPMRLTHNGQRIPVEECDRVEATPGKAMLHGRCGVDLLNTFQDDINNEAVHNIADRVVSDLSSYNTDIDDPGTSPQLNQEVQSASGASEMQNNFLSALDPTTPLIADTSNGELRVQQTCWTQEGENFDSGSESGVGGISGDYSGGVAATLVDTSDSITFNFELDHEIPDGSFGIGLRVTREGSDYPRTRVKVDGNSVGKRKLGLADIQWVDDIFELSEFTRPGALSPGIHTFTIEATQDKSIPLAVDVVAPHDTRYNYFFDNDNGGSDGYLDGPQYYPDAVSKTFADAQTSYNVSGGRIESSYNNTENDQQVAISNDQGGNYLTADNTENYEDDFGSDGGSLRWRATLSRHGTTSGQTPKTGIDPQRLTGYTLYADLESTPVLDRRSLSGSGLTVLQQLADYGNYIFSIDMDRFGDVTFRMTQPDLRTEQRSPEQVLDYSVEKSVEQFYEKVTIRGGSQNRRAEPFTSNYGTWVSLSNDDMVDGTEVVYDPANGTEYIEGQDYEMQYGAGEIKVLSNGSMSDSTTYEITYRYKPVASYTVAGASANPRSLSREFPSVTTESGCQQMARRIAQRLSTPRWSARVVVSKDDLQKSLVDTITVPGVPTQDTNVEIRRIDENASTVTLFLGNWENVRDVIDEVKKDVIVTETRS